jgi:phage-related protein
VQAAEGETWSGIESALRAGVRGLAGGSSLAQLLSEHRSVRNIHDLPPLTVEQILNWADEHQKRTGKWPTRHSGPIHTAEGETWNGVDTALKRGGRGLTGGSSLAQLLSEHCGVRNIQKLSPLTIKQILNWADVHQKQTGKWPNQKSGTVLSAEGETWSGVDTFLYKGRRGLSGGSSLAQLLSKYRGVRNKGKLPSLTIKQILKWADEHYEMTSKWPNQKSGPVLSEKGETWSGVDTALYRGSRGLSGVNSLAQLLSKRRGVKRRH